MVEIRHAATRHNEKDTIRSDTCGVTLVGVLGHVIKALGHFINTTPSHLRHTREYVLGGLLLICCTCEAPLLNRHLARRCSPRWPVLGMMEMNEPLELLSNQGEETLAAALPDNERRLSRASL